MDYQMSNIQNTYNTVYIHVPPQIQNTYNNTVYTPVPQQLQNTPQEQLLQPTHIQIPNEIDWSAYAELKHRMYCMYCLNDRLVPCGAISNSGSGLCHHHIFYENILAEMTSISKKHYAEGLSIYKKQYRDAVKNNTNTYEIVSQMLKYSYSYKPTMCQMPHTAKMIYNKILEIEQHMQTGENSDFHLENCKQVLFSDLFPATNTTTNRKRRNQNSDIVDLSNKKQSVQNINHSDQIYN